MIKQIKISLLTLLIFINCSSQTKNTDFEENEVVNEDLANIKEFKIEEIQKLFVERIKDDLGILGSIKKVFEYNDKSGLKYLVTAQDNNDNSESESIQFLILRKENKKLSKMEVIKDSVLISNESNIFIWHKYLTIDDIDKDGFVDLIFVYGTKGDNGFDDGRVVQIILYKNTKTVIKHQNASLDDDRSTLIESSYYGLPIEIKEEVHSKINSMIENRLAIFNYDALKKFE